MKLAYLMRQRTAIREQMAFYDFVPSSDGPYSFFLLREIDRLTDLGYLVPDRSGIRLLPHERVGVVKMFRGLPVRTRRALSDFALRYAKMDGPGVAQEAEADNAWYFRSPCEAAEEKPDLAVFTVGYEGKSVDGFFNGLLRSGIERLADVRANALSRKFGFSRSTLKRIVDDLGVEYVHLAELGIPSSMRTDLNDYESYQRLLDEYEHRMLPNCQKALRRVADLVASSRTALLCQERDPLCCHRSRVAKAVSEMTGLSVYDLR